MARIRKYGLIAGVLALLLTPIAATPAHASTTTYPCNADMVFIGVRGTDAPAGSSVSQNGAVWLSGGYGDQVQPLRNKFASMDMTVYSASINYPASTNIVASINEGRDKLVGFLNSLTSCTWAPMVVLAGHSQGADVVAEALANANLSPTVRMMVRAAVMYGDPNAVAGANYLAPGSATNIAGDLFGRGAGQEAVLQGSDYWKYGWPYMGNGQGYYSKIRSWCFTGDWACTTTTINDASMAVHNSYKNIAQTAYDWAIYMTSQFN